MFSPGPKGWKRLILMAPFREYDKAPTLCSRHGISCLKVVFRRDLSSFSRSHINGASYLHTATARERETGRYGHTIQVNDALDYNAIKS